MVYTVNGVQYTRRKKIPVTGAASGAQTDYQIKLTALWADAMQADYDDARFVKADMQTLIDAWLESKTDSTTADIWAEFPMTPADGVETTEAYMYYGNSAVASDWNIKETFVLGDDFRDSSIDTNLWAATGSVSEGAGGMTISSNANRNVNYVTSVATYDRTQAYISEMVYQQSNAAPVDSVGGFGTSGLFANGLGLYAEAGTNCNRVLDGSYISSWTTSSRSANTDWKMKVLLKATQGFTLWDMYNLDADYTQRDDNAAWATNNVKVRLGNAYTNSNILIKQVTLRKYVANPPTAAFGTEEHQRRTPMMM